MFFEETAEWRAEWDRVSHLVSRLIEALSEMATAGVCSRISKNMAYTLFTNVVDYADKYRGMDMVVLHEYEAYADISLAPETYGNWHIPLHWIDSVSHLAGLVMNASDVSNTKNFFYLNPGFGTLRFIGPFRLLRSIAITFACSLLATVEIFTLFTMISLSPACITTPVPTAPAKKVVISPPQMVEIKTAEPVQQVVVNVETESGVIGNCISPIARETGLEVSEITDETTFEQTGVDSLMSLVVAEKFRNYSSVSRAFCSLTVQQLEA